MSRYPTERLQREAFLDQYAQKLVNLQIVNGYTYAQMVKVLNETNIIPTMRGKPWNRELLKVWLQRARAWLEEKEKQATVDQVLDKHDDYWEDRADLHKAFRRGDHSYAE